MSQSILQRTTPAVKNLIIINALAYFAQTVISQTPWGRVEDVFALHYHKSMLFKPFQILTHMFMHGGIFHLLFNMLALWMFGVILERVWGTKRFLIFYFICGVAAAFAQMLSYAYFFKDVNMSVASDASAMATFSAALGASGAVMGVAAAFARLFPNTPLFIFPLPVPIKAKWAILGFFAFSVFSGVANVSGDNIAHFAHLGGGIAGYLLTIFWNRNNKQQFY